MSKNTLPSSPQHCVPSYPVDTMVSVPVLDKTATTPSPAVTPPAVAYDRPFPGAFPGYVYDQFALGYAPAPLGYPLRVGYYHEQEPHPYPHEHALPSSPDSGSASSRSPATPPMASQNPTTGVTSEQPALVTPLVPSSSPVYSNPTTERVKETIARANSVPMEFYQTEFLEYSKEAYEKKKSDLSRRIKRKRGKDDDAEATGKKAKHDAKDDEEDDKAAEKQGDEDDESHTNDSAEMRRQIHIQSEQKRRAQIKGGFDELRNHLPGCDNKKMSKAALLTRTVQQIQHLKNTQMDLLQEVERLIQENEMLRKFQHSVLQRQAMEKMYSF